MLLEDLFARFSPSTLPNGVSFVLHPLSHALSADAYHHSPDKKLQSGEVVRS